MWVLPTLNRPEQCAEVLARIKASGCTTPGIVFLNGQETVHGYFQSLDLPDGWRVLVSKDNIGAIGALNKVFELYPDEKFYGFIGDDEFLMEHSPLDWDQRLVRAAGDWDFSHGLDNLHQGKRAQGYLCIGGKLARTLGYLAIPECWHWYGLDDMWESLAKSKVCRNVLVPEVQIEHRHYLAGAAPKDECYTTGESYRDIDQQEYFHWMRTKLYDIAKRVRRAKNGQ